MFPGQRTPRGAGSDAGPQALAAGTHRRSVTSAPRHGATMKLGRWAGGARRGHFQAGPAQSGQGQGCHTLQGPGPLKGRGMQTQGWGVLSRLLVGDLPLRGGNPVACPGRKGGTFGSAREGGWAQAGRKPGLGSPPQWRVWGEGARGWARICLGLPLPCSGAPCLPARVAFKNRGGSKPLGAAHCLTAAPPGMVRWGSRELHFPDGGEEAEPGPERGHLPHTTLPPPPL